MKHQIDALYGDLHKRILSESASLQPNRTAVETAAVFGADIMLDPKTSFPSTTLSATFNRGGFVELCWIYMKGGTNVDYLHEHNVHFWDQWALEEDVYEVHPLTDHARIKLYEEKTGKRIPATAWKPFCDKLDKLLKSADIPEELRLLTHRKGDLGPVYGQLARAYPTVVVGEDGDFEIGHVDQIATLIDDLRRNPGSRRHVVSLWQPGLLPDETLSPQENVIRGKQALAPCHWAFVVMTRKLTLEERFRTPKHPNEQYDEVDHRKTIDFDMYQELALVKGSEMSEVRKHAILTMEGVPEYELNLHLIMRSSDVPAGLRLNIVCYAALQHALAAEVGMSVGKLWYTGTNAHIYADQIPAVEKYVNNAPSEQQVRLWVNPDKSFFDLEPEDFKLEGYVPNERVPVPVAK